VEITIECFLANDKLQHLKNFQRSIQKQTRKLLMGDVQEVLLEIKVD
jgi:hypothetical protein